MSKRVGMLGSGSLTTIGASYRGIINGEVKDVELGCCIVSNEKARDNALKFEIPAALIFLIRPKDYPQDDSRVAFGNAINDVFDRMGVDFYAQLGWVPYTPDNVLEKRSGFNQHPAPVDPGYLDFGGPGMNNRAPHMARLIFCKRVNRRDPPRNIMWTEMTTQFVDKQPDKGAIILTERVPIFMDDDPLLMQERMKPIEHKLVMRTMEAFPAGKAVPYERPDRLVQLPGDFFDYAFAME